MEQSYQPKHTAKKEPGEYKSQTEDNQHPPPANVYTCGKDVCEVPLSLLTHVDELYIAVAILLHKAAPALLPSVDFTLPIPKAIGNRHGSQLHTVFFRRNNAIPVGSHTAHRFCLGLQCLCFGKQSEFLQNPLEKQF
jgi:hypothetical protein